MSAQLLPARVLLPLLAVLALTGVSVSATAATPTSTGTATGARVVDLCNQHVSPGTFSCYAQRRSDVAISPRTRFHRATATAAAVNPQGYSPSQLASAYKLPTANGAGQRVFVIDAYAYPDAEADLAAYRSQFKLPACTTANGCFVKVNQEGATTPAPPADPDRNKGWAGETALDLDMVSAACPKCAITLVESNDDSDGLYAAVQEAVSMGAKFVSMSWGGDEYDGQTDDDQNVFGAAGVDYVAAAGDDGWGASYPATSSNVVAVGGTSLQKASNARGWTETAWHNTYGATGSGCSVYDAKPSWEAAIPTATCPGRAESDVSASADPAHGVAVYETYAGLKGGWGMYGGTSAATPIIAATYALAGTPSTTLRPQQRLWADRGMLNDVTSGTNGTCSTSVCRAGVGWDGPTGLGSPDGISAFTTNHTTPASSQAPGSYVPVSVTRLLDTRNGTGTSTTGARAAGSATPVQVAGVGGVPSTGVQAVALNVTAVSPSGAGAVTAYADGATRPATSSLSFASGATSTGLVVAPVGSDGTVNLYVNKATQLVADVAGYYVGGSATDAGTFTAVTPYRLHTGQLATGKTVAVTAAGVDGVPTGARAALVTLTAASPTGAGAVTAYADGTARPGIGALNYAKGVTASNAAVVPLGADGKFDLYVNRTTQVLADVVGYYAGGTPTGLGTYAAVSPRRVLDSRSSGGALRDASARTVRVTGAGGVPSTGVRAVVVDLTSVSPAGAGYLTAYAGGGARPGTSNLSYARGQSVADLAIVPVSSSGTIAVYASRSTQVLVDISGYVRATG